jgi:hypothetical protein
LLSEPASESRELTEKTRQVELVDERVPNDLRYSQAEQQRFVEDEPEISPGLVLRPFPVSASC